MTNTERYQTEVARTSSAGVGVILTRTREPFRAVNALKELAFSKALPFGVWNVRDGWTIQKPTDLESHKAKPDKIVDAYKAIKRIQDIDGDGTLSWDSGFYVMTAFHHWLGKVAGVTECLRQYVRDFSESKNLRLIIVVPEGEVLSDELQHDIPTIDFDLPDREEIKAIYEFVVESATPEGEEVPQLFDKKQVDILTSSASGMTEMEIQVAFSKGINQSRKSKSKHWNDVDFDTFNRVVLAAKTEVVKQSEVLELIEPIAVSDVGGQEEFKEWISIVAECDTPDAIADGVDPAKGCVVVGPPGTGKTLLSKMSGTVLRRPIVLVSINKCFAGIVGSSEAKARAAIKQLEAMSPCIAVVDEVDKALGGAHKGGGDSGVGLRVLGIFLTAMQESKAPIFWMLTANRTEGLPSELLRKGRTDEVWAVLPPKKSERASVFAIHLNKRKVDPKKVVDLEVAVEASKGFVSAEIEGAVKEAKKLSRFRKEPVTGDLLCECLRNMKPISEAFPEDFQAMETWASNNARNASSPEEEDEVTKGGVEKINFTAARRRKRRVTIEE